MNVKNQLNRFLRDMIECNKNGQYYAALAIALALPDICSSLIPQAENRVGIRYCTWIDSYFIEQNNYNTTIGETVRLTSKDVYKLRCAYLHSGTDELRDVRLVEDVNKFVFIVSPTGRISMHRNLTINGDHKECQLDVKKFCEEIEVAVKEFMESINDNQILNDLLLIQNVDNGGTLF